MEVLGSWRIGDRDRSPHSGRTRAVYSTWSFIQSGDGMSVRPGHVGQESVIDPIRILRVLLQRRLQVVVITALAMTSAACTKVQRAGNYPQGSDVKVMISELGKPDIDRPYVGDIRKSNMCPADAVRVMEYRRSPVLPLLDEGAVAVVCVDKSDRVLIVRVGGV